MFINETRQFFVSAFNPQGQEADNHLEKEKVIMADLFCLMIKGNCFFIVSLRQKQARCSGRAVTFGEERLIDETTHFPVWNDYRSQSEGSTQASLRLFLSLTNLAVKTKSRKEGGTFLEIFISSTSDTCVSSRGYLFTGLSFCLGDIQ